MVAQQRGRKFLKITGIILGTLVVLLVAFHFWFRAHAKQMIEDLVESTSHGKVKLTIGKLHFNYFSRKIRLDDALFYSPDSLQDNTSYRFHVEKIDLRAKAILPILFKKKILIDSLALSNPQIEVVRLKPIAKDSNRIKKEVSIPEEMGKIYSSIQDALKVLQVKRFVIENGTFTLLNKMIPGQLPMKISNLHFQIDNLQVDSTQQHAKDKILFSDNVIFTSHDQDILFPDGRHRLSFSHFRINLQQQLVEFDSCTIAATRSDSAAAAFDVFFDGLDLINIDFDTLYKSEVIKADSVYCTNPRFNLEVDVSKRKEKGKPPPKLENIIQQLTGDLLLESVVVTNADFNIKTIKEGRPSTFTFSENNFEMKGLSVDQEAAKPVKVESFAMAIRNYENFIKDSSYSIQFDSVILKDDRITLNNFIFNNLENGKIKNTFSIPQFNLQGLSWDDLVFERRLKAEQAIMFNPHISYTASRKHGRQNLFVSLGVVNEYMDLQFLDIREGTIDLRLKNNLQVQLEHANVAVQSNSLLNSTKVSGIRNSLTNLTFRKGRVQAGDLLIEVDDLRYAGPNDRLEAGSMHVKSNKKNLDVLLKGLSAETMLVDEVSGNVFANGLSWQQGIINMNLGFLQAERQQAIVELNRVRGYNTALQLNHTNTRITTQLNTLSFSTLERKPVMPFQLTGLSMDGEQLQVKNDQLDLSSQTYAIHDLQRSSFKEFNYKNQSGTTHTELSLPTLHLVPDIQSLLDGNMVFRDAELENPVVKIMVTGKKQKTDPVSRLPSLDIRGLKIVQPHIQFTEARDSGHFSFLWEGEKNASNFLQADDFFLSQGKYQLNQLRFFLSNFKLQQPGKRTFSAGNGHIHGLVHSFALTTDAQNESEWRTQISNFHVNDFRLDSFGQAKGNLQLKTGTIENLDLGSATILNLREIAANNKRFQLKHFSGHYADAVKKLSWQEAGFTRDRNIFSADSFSYTPALDKDRFMAGLAFQKDYITLKTGRVYAGPVDFDSYITSNKLQAGFAHIDQLFFTDYKDKRIPFNPGIIKSLPVDLLKKIPSPIAVDSIHLTDAVVLYSEITQKGAEGIFRVTQMNARLLNVANFDRQPGDSLYIEASGRLLDQAMVRMTVKESYTDSLGGFLMTAQAGPADLRFLNPVMIPLASTRIESGQLDTIYMRATGREYLAWGEMEMRYRNLKVSLLKEGGENKKKFLSRLANTIVKNKNESRTGQVFFIRQRDRSAINYLIKIAMSGIKSSIGVQNNKKRIRQAVDKN